MTEQCTTKLSNPNFFSKLLIFGKQVITKISYADIQEKTKGNQKKPRENRELALLNNPGMESQFLAGTTS
jgi:hypothetical protein